MEAKIEHMHATTEPPLMKLKEHIRQERCHAQQIFWPHHEVRMQGSRSMHKKVWAHTRACNNTRRGWSKKPKINRRAPTQWNRHLQSVTTYNRTPQRMGKWAHIMDKICTTKTGPTIWRQIDIEEKKLAYRTLQKNEKKREGPILEPSKNKQPQPQNPQRGFLVRKPWSMLLMSTTERWRNSYRAVYKWLLLCNRRPRTRTLRPSQKIYLELSWPEQPNYRRRVVISLDQHDFKVSWIKLSRKIGTTHPTRGEKWPLCGYTQGEMGKSYTTILSHGYFQNKAGD